MSSLPHAGSYRELIVNQCAEIGRMLNSMNEKAHRFCQSPPNQIRESSPEYFIFHE